MKNKFISILAIVGLALGLASAARADFQYVHGYGVQTLTDIVDMDIVSVQYLTGPAVTGSDVWDLRAYLYGGNKVSIDFDTDVSAGTYNCGAYAYGAPSVPIYLILY